MTPMHIQVASEGEFTSSRWNQKQKFEAITI
jgi:hypothetical protein